MKSEQYSSQCFPTRRTDGLGVDLARVHSCLGASGLEAFGKDGMDNGLIWGRSTIICIRSHSKHEEVSVPCEYPTVSPVNPLATEAV